MVDLINKICRERLTHMEGCCCEHDDETDPKHGLSLMHAREIYSPGKGFSVTCMAIDANKNPGCCAGLWCTRAYTDVRIYYL
jgi:hypothetical protein